MPPAIRQRLRLAPATSNFTTTANTAPVISSLIVMPGLGGKAVFSWTTNVQANSVVKYGTSSGSLNQTVTDSTMVTSHRVTVTGLTQGNHVLLPGEFHQRRKPDGHLAGFPGQLRRKCHFDLERRHGAAT